MTIYKPSKNLQEQIDYLKEYKNINFNEISEEEAKEILLKYNYINIISPFKHYFFKKDEKRQPIKENDRHVYEKSTEFKEYYEKYLNERSQYPIIAKNILYFDNQFKAILAYRIFDNYKITSQNDFYDFFDRLNYNLLKSSQSRLGFFKEKNTIFFTRLQEKIEDIKKEVGDHHDPYCFFDRLNLGKARIIFIALDFEVQDVIFSDLKRYNLSLGVDKASDFVDRLFTLVGIRNKIMHSNSLEIFILYFNEHSNRLSNSADRKRKHRMIKYLNNENLFE